MDVTAQFLYDLREKYEFCSGNDLSEFFRETLGEPSPSGKKHINKRDAAIFVWGCCRAIEHNSNYTVSMTECAQKISL